MVVAWFASLVAHWRVLRTRGYKMATPTVLDMPMHSHIGGMGVKLTNTSHTSTTEAMNVPCMAMHGYAGHRCCINPNRRKY
jgi:hypothetical protein